MQLFRADATIFSKKKKKIPTKSWKNHPQTQIHFFSLLPWGVQTAKTEEFMFQNVAVYKLFIKLRCAHSLENLIKIQAAEICNQKSLHHILRMFAI